MNKLQRYVHAHPKVLRGFFWVCLVFFGCFAYPLGSRRFPMDWTRAYLILSSYGITGLGLAVGYGAGRGKTLWLPAVGCIALGMLGRWLLEYGEVSNTWNFTPFNIIAYLLVTPALTLAAYHLSGKYLLKNQP